MLRPGGVFDLVCPSADLWADTALLRMGSGDPCEMARPFQKVLKVETILTIILQHYLPLALICSGRFSTIFQESVLRIQICAFSDVKFVLVLLLSSYYLQLFLL